MTARPGFSPILWPAVVPWTPERREACGERYCGDLDERCVCCGAKHGRRDGCPPTPPIVMVKQ